MKFLLMLTFILTGILVMAGQTAELEGEWINVDSRGGGITRVVVVKAEKGWVIEAWGKCHPQDCAWGPTTLAPVGNAVEDYSFNQGFAIWDAGFATKYVSLILNKGQVTAETVTIFRDRSRRAHFKFTDVLQRPENALDERVDNTSSPRAAANGSSSRNAEMDEIRRLEVEWNRINEISSADGKRRLLAEDSYHVGPSGRTYTKAQDVASMAASFKQKQESNTIVRFSIADMKIRFYKDVAVVTAMGNSITTENGAERRGKLFRVIHVWEKRDGRWQIVVDQVTAVTN